MSLLICLMAWTTQQDASYFPVAVVSLNNFNASDTLKLLEEHRDVVGEAPDYYWDLKKFLSRRYWTSARSVTNTGFALVTDARSTERITYEVADSEDRARFLIEEFAKQWAPPVEREQPLYSSHVTTTEAGLWQLTVSTLTWTPHLGPTKTTYTSESRPFGSWYFRFENGVLWSSKSPKPLMHTDLKSVSREISSPTKADNLLSIWVSPQSLPQTYKDVLTRRITAPLLTQSQWLDGEENDEALDRGWRMRLLATLASLLITDTNLFELSLSADTEGYQVNAELSFSANSNGQRWLKSLYTDRQSSFLVPGRQTYVTSRFAIPATRISGDKLDVLPNSKDNQWVTFASRIETTTRAFSAKALIRGWSPQVIQSRIENLRSSLSRTPMMRNQELNVSHNQTEDMLDLNISIGEEPAEVGRLQSELRDERGGRGADLVASISSDTLHDLVEWYSSNAWEQVKDETSTRVGVSLSAKDSTAKARARVPKALVHHVIYILQTATYDFQRQ